MQLRWKWPIERNRIENQILSCKKTSTVPCIRYELLSSLIESFRIYVDQFHKLKSKRGWRRCKNFWNLSWNLLSSTPLSSNKRAYESKMKAKRFWKFNIDPVLLEWNGGIGGKMKLIVSEKFNYQAKAQNTFSSHLKHSTSSRIMQNNKSPQKHTGACKHPLSRNSLNFHATSSRINRQKPKVRFSIIGDWITRSKSVDEEEREEDRLSNSRSRRKISRKQGISLLSESTYFVASKERRSDTARRSETIEEKGREKRERGACARRGGGFR